jgi:hypothetical protein
MLSVAQKGLCLFARDDIPRHLEMFANRAAAGATDQQWDPNQRVLTIMNAGNSKRIIHHKWKKSQRAVAYEFKHQLVLQEECLDEWTRHCRDKWNRYNDPIRAFFWNRVFLAYDDKKQPVVQMYIPMWNKLPMHAETVWSVSNACNVYDDGPWPKRPLSDNVARLRR